MSNRTLHIYWKNSKKPDIEVKKPDIKISNILEKQITILKENLDSEEYFSRKDIIKVLNVKSSRASEIINKLLEIKVIEHVKGHDKGKYIFIN